MHILYNNKMDTPSTMLIYSNMSDINFLKECASMLLSPFIYIYETYNYVNYELFVIFFVFSFMSTMFAFILIFIGQLIDLLVMLIKKLDGMHAKNIIKQELIYILENSEQEKKCISPNCKHSLAKYIYVNTKTRPIEVVFFCEKHFSIFFKKNNVQITENDLPSYLF